MAEEYIVQAVMNDLKEKTEMDPDQHDGSYELMRETIEAYSKLKDFSVIDYKDLNLVYLTTVGTWKQGVEEKKKTVAESHLLQEDKEYLSILWDEIWEKANRGEYTNNELDASGKSSIGLFGTGFFSFQRTTTSECAQAFIRMCCDILPMTDDYEMFDRAESVLTASFKGMRAASASMVLHCLKPYSFPVLNSNMGRDNVFEVLGVKLNKRGNIETYIENCRRIKAFRDANFTYKNYRIFDIAAWKAAELTKKHEYGKFGYWEVLSESVARLDCYGGENVLGQASIPSEIRWFFRVSELRTGARQEVVLVHDGFEYDGYFLRESVVPIQIRLFWDEGLSEEFGTPAKTGEEVFLEFTRIEDDRFEVKLIESAQSKETNMDSKYGITKIASFLKEYAGKHYTAPLRAGDQADYMSEMRRRGQEARQLFIDFVKDAMKDIPDLEYASCSNWINQGQVVQRYIWIELKRQEWWDKPNSVSVSIERRKDAFGDETVITVRAETKDIASEAEDYNRQFRLLDCDLQEGMSYLVVYKNGDHHYHETNTEKVREVCNKGNVQKLEIIEVIDELARDEKTILSETKKAIKEIYPLYEYVMGVGKTATDDEWWPSLEEYDPGITADEYKKFFTTESIVKRTWLEALYELYKMPDHAASCKQLADQYGYSPSHYISYFSTAGENIQKETGIGSPEDDKNAKCWPVLFQGKNSQYGYCYKMRKPVVEAVEDIFLTDEEGWFPRIEEYDPGISAEQYEAILRKGYTGHVETLSTVYYLYKMGGSGTCAEVANKYGGSPFKYVGHVNGVMKYVASESKCPVQKRTDSDGNRLWAVLFYGKPQEPGKPGTWAYKLREPLAEAVASMEADGFFDELTGKKQIMHSTFDHNIILYGPPGTGKTYHSVIYAVAICDGETIEEVEQRPYSEILERYKELKEEGRIAFTTFHQSYGYEEFIEGIKPKLNDDSGTLGYTIEDGVFKDFCRRANKINIQPNGNVMIKDHPRIWVMLLGGPGMTALKQECFNDGEVRIGWPEVGDEEWDNDEGLSWRAKQMLHAFTYEMEPGDIVFIEKDSQSIDAIGVITGEYEYDKSLGEYPRKREVEWIAKNIDEDMVQYLPSINVFK